MNNKLSLTFILTPLLLVVTNYGQDARAEVEPVWVPLLGTDALKVHSLHSDGERLYGGTRNGLYISDDDGSTWRPTELDVPYDVLTIHRNTVYATVPPNGIFRSDDRGETWNPINNGLPLRFWDDGDSYYPFFRQIFVTSSGTVILVSSSHLYTSTDRGDTWRDVTQEWLREDKTSVASLVIESLTEFDGYLWVGELVTMRSPDRGDTWEYTGSIKGARFPFDWAVWDNRLYAVGVHGMARWNETKGHWEDLRAGLPPKTIVLAPPAFYTVRIIIRSEEYYLTSFAVNRERFFVGLRDKGVYMFDHRTETWVYAGLAGLRVTSLVSHRSQLYASTSGRDWGNYAGVWPRSKYHGIFRADVPSPVDSYGKRVTTWGAIK